MDLLSQVLTLDTLCDRLEGTWACLGIVWTNVWGFHQLSKSFSFSLIIKMLLVCFRSTEYLFTLNILVRVELHRTESTLTSFRRRHLKHILAYKITKSEKQTSKRQSSSAGETTRSRIRPSCSVHTTTSGIPAPVS